MIRQQITITELFTTFMNDPSIPTATEYFNLVNLEESFTQLAQYWQHCQHRFILASLMGAGGKVGGRSLDIKYCKFLDIASNLLHFKHQYSRINIHNWKVYKHILDLISSNLYVTLQFRYFPLSSVCCFIMFKPQTLHLIRLSCKIIILYSS